MAEVTYALTTWQPWTSLLVLGIKPYEFRDYSLPIRIKGRRVVMHAAKRVPKAQELQDILKRLYAGKADGMVRNRAIDLLEKAWRDSAVLPLSAGLGSVVLSDSTPCDRLFPNDEEASPERWGWHAERPVAWDEPQPQSGLQGFWRWPRTLRGNE